MCVYAYAYTSGLCLFLWLICRAVLSSDEPLQDLVLDASGDCVCVPYFDRSNIYSSEEEDDVDSNSASSCAVLCAPVCAEEKEDWDAV